MGGAMHVMARQKATFPALASSTKKSVARVSTPSATDFSILTFCPLQPLQPLLKPQLQQKGGKHAGDQCQGGDLLLCPAAVFPAVVKAHVAPEHAVVHDGALQHGADSLGREDFVQLLVQLADVPAVKNPFRIKVGEVVP